jgi:CRISPR-associated protein Cas5d
MKVERVSYDVITPSAARAIFDAILWKPAIRWQVMRIEVLNPIRWINLRRNEVGSVIPAGNVKKAMNGTLSRLALDVEDDRQQRAGLFLRDVRYRLHARFELLDKSESPAKYSEMFERRARKGQCFSQPYLGCREFSCDFRLATNDTPAPISESRDLGWMLYDRTTATRNPRHRASSTRGWKTASSPCRSGTERRCGDDSSGAL